MRARILVPFTAILALAACGEDQTAQAPVTPTAPPVTETAEAPPPPAPAAPAPVAEAPAPTAGTGTVVAPSETTGATTPAPSPGSAQTAAVAATSLEPFHGRTYAAGPVTLQLNPDKTFVMRETGSSRKVEGRYAYENGVLIFSDATGDTGTVQFPMHCRFITEGASNFRLADTGGACTQFKDLTFEPAAG
ncbi:hypothetical protein [Microvirga splendida]|uniref:Uncharacterized protein n=1 Tax=Microvirga splendida TaxID=2795727 RepID=A0ABS0Y4J5_9HYPH|nr:hypothetical protein [Microvirga splendida]MBJ6126813.1 hypothetical protein [Microvirga splendida]